MLFHVPPDDIQRSTAAPATQIAQILRSLIGNSKIIADDPAVQAVLDLLDKGAGFADGVIANKGQRLGSDVFVSFDRRPVRLLQAAGVADQSPT